MTDYCRPDDGNMSLTKTTDGTLLVANAGGAPTTFGCTLIAATYVLPFGNATAPMPSQTVLASVHLRWAAAVAAIITVETCNFPATIGNRAATGPDDTTDWDITNVGNWVQENPSTGYVAVVGTGNSATGLTITAGGTNAGGATIHLGNFGTRRMRLKIVATVGGLMRLATHGKLGA